jgi:hypothetical protein
MKRINFETAKLLHQVDTSFSSEAGYYDEKEGLDYACPYQAELQSWLRNEHLLDVVITAHADLEFNAIWDENGYSPGEYKTYYKGYILHNRDNWKVDKHEILFEDYELTYEDSLEEGLVQSLKMIIK